MQLWHTVSCSTPRLGSLQDTQPAHAAMTHLKIFAGLYGVTVDDLQGSHMKPKRQPSCGARYGLDLDAVTSLVTDPSSQGAVRVHLVAPRTQMTRHNMLQSGPTGSCAFHRWLCGSFGMSRWIAWRACGLYAGTPACPSQPRALHRPRQPTEVYGIGLAQMPPSSFMIFYQPCIIASSDWYPV